MFRTLSVCFCKLANRAVARSIPSSSSPSPRLDCVLPRASLTYGWNHTHPTHARDRPRCAEARQGEARQSNQVSQSVSQSHTTLHRSARAASGVERNEWRVGISWRVRGWDGEPSKFYFMKTCGFMSITHILKLCRYKMMTKTRLLPRRDASDAREG